MKKIIARIFLIVILIVSTYKANICAKEIPAELMNLYAQSAVLMDADSGRILFGKNEGKVLPMASTTKIMTCILALEYMKNDYICEVSDYAASQPKVRLGVKRGEKYYLKDLLYSLMLESHNDSAVVIAEAISGSVTEFATMMNHKAKELGCRNTYFITPNGLDAKDDYGAHSTTAQDLALIMRYCIQESPQKEQFLEITRRQSYQFTDIEGKRTYTCNNHNAFLGMMEGALSGKTGFTNKAGYCYVGALRQGERTFIVALLACGWPNNKGYKWSDTRRLMEHGLNNYEYREFEKDIPFYNVSVVNGVNCSNPLQKQSLVRLELESENTKCKILMKKDEKIDVKIIMKDRLYAPVDKYEKVGVVFYVLNNIILYKNNIIAGENVAVKKYEIQWILDKYLL